MSTDKPTSDQTKSHKSLASPKSLKSSQSAQHPQSPQNPQSPKGLFFPSYQRAESREQPLDSMILAIKNQANPELKILLKDNPLKDKVDLRSLLIEAIYSNNIEAVKLVLDAGADPNFIAEDGHPALSYAIKPDGEKMVEVLLERGADPNLLPTDQTPLLSRAITYGTVSIVQRLLERGADPQALDADALTPMDHALVERHPEIVKLLRECLTKSSYQELVQKVMIFQKTGAVLGVDMQMPFHCPDGRVMQFSSMGGLGHSSVPWLMHYLNQHCEKLKSRKSKIPYEAFKKILKAYTLEVRRLLLDSEVGFKELIDAYKRDEFVFVSGGWFKHDIGTAFYKKKGGFVNRGAAGIHEDYGTGIFEISDETQIDESLFENLQSKEDNGPKVMNAISQLAGTNKMDFMETRHQKWRTCYYSNIKPCVEIFLYWAARDYSISDVNARSFALREYKEFTEFTRDEMCQELIALYRAHPKDQEFYENLFREIIKTHHGYTVKQYSRNRERKMEAELNRAAMLIQVIADVDKKRAHEFLKSLDLVGEVLKLEAKNCKPLMKVLEECDFLQGVPEDRPKSSEDKSNPPEDRSKSTGMKR